MGASGTGAGVTGVAGASVTAAEAASPSRIRGVRIGCVCGWRSRQARARLAQHRGRVRAAGEARNAADSLAQAGATRRATALACASGAACAILRDKYRAELRRRQPPLLTMAHFRMSACLTRPVRLVRERELGDLGVVARPRERTQAGGRPTCGMTLRIKLYRDDRGPSRECYSVPIKLRCRVPGVRTRFATPAPEIPWSFTTP